MCFFRGTGEVCFGGDHCSGGRRGPHHQMSACMVEARVLGGCVIHGSVTAIVRLKFTGVCIGRLGTLYRRG
uniref:Uncharacterized protein n=1 Tax=Arundo donax TaxID=35708 RepID=A0A0A8YMV3_ARUDO